MQAIVSALLAVLVAQAAPAHTAAPTVTSPLLGHWTLDVSKLSMPPEVRPKSVRLVFTAVGDQWPTRVEIVDQNGGKMASESTLSLDGTPAPATGTYWVDVLAAKMPSPNVLIMQFVYQHTPTSTRVFSVDAEGKVMTETEAYFTKEGTPKMRTAFYTRAPG